MSRTPFHERMFIMKVDSHQPAGSALSGSPCDKIRRGLCIGSPERIIEAIKKWESVGTDRVNFLLNAMEVVPQKEVLKSLRLFAKEVMPQFRKSEKAEPATALAGA